MSQRLADWTRNEVEVELHRDYEPAAARIPGMALGVRRLTGLLRPLAADLHSEGARQARLGVPVDLCVRADASSARALVLIRELTAHGVVVDWTARCVDGCADSGVLHHLFPPARIDGVTDQTTADRWRESFFLGKCVFRHGPGFVEVRDRRFGSLEIFTVDAPEHLAALPGLVEGVDVAELAPQVRREFADAHLIAEHAGHLWWLPTRTYRWPFPALAV